MSIELDAELLSLLNEGSSNEYIDLLCIKALPWWFEMRIPEIAAHLQAITSISTVQPTSPRLLFLYETIKPAMSPDVFEDLYAQFEKLGDHEWAIATACAGATSIWDSGIGFERYTKWERRITHYQSQSITISGLAKAALLVFMGQIQLTRDGDVKQALKTYRQLMIQAEICGSLSLKAFAAAVSIYPLLWMNRRTELEAMMTSASPLAGRAEVSLFCGVYFQIHLGLALALIGNAERGESLLNDVISHANFSLLAPSIQLLAIGHLLTVLAYQNKETEVKRLAEEMLSRSVPNNNSFHNSFALYCMGAVAILIEQPHKAYAYAREALERGESVGSPIPWRMSSLLEAQALSDISHHDEAIKLLEKWLPRWRDSNFLLLATAGEFELANIFFKQGAIEKARIAFCEAQEMVTEENRLPLLHRPATFIERLEEKLLPSNNPSQVWQHPETARINVSTFGELVVYVDGQRIYDRHWRGGVTKRLLNYLIAFGGRKVPLAALEDMIWPDAEGHVAEQNMKTTIHRLRKAVSNNTINSPWLMVKHKCLSLSSSICSVDSLYFEERIKQFLKNDIPADFDILKNTLDLYRGDFLADDNGDSWISRRRQKLQYDYIQGAVALAKLSTLTHRELETIIYLEKAIEIMPLEEKLYEHLMSAHLVTGYPSHAVQIYHQAEDTLKNELGVAVGENLRGMFDQIDMIS